MFGLETHLFGLPLFPPAHQFGLSPFPQAHLFRLPLFPQAHLFGLETHLIGPLVVFLFTLQFRDLRQPKHDVADAPSI